MPTFSTRLLLLTLVAVLLVPTETFAHGMSLADKQAIIDGGNLRFLSLGVTHMLSGYDHLLFIFGIIFFLNTFGYQFANDDGKIGQSHHHDGERNASGVWLD